MTNSVIPVTKFAPILDEVLEKEAITGVFDTPSNLIGEFSGAGEVKIPIIEFDGLGDYDRETGLRFITS